MSNKILIKVFKTLSRNDTGETNSHQSGISIPKKVASSGIFPDLGIEMLNPRQELIFFDEDNRVWKFQYIYYNDVYFGKPKKLSHNEYRLTCVKSYIKENNILANDVIWFSIDDNGVRRVGFEKYKDIEEKPITSIKLGNGWHTIKI